MRLLREQRCDECGGTQYDWKREKVKEREVWAMAGEVVESGQKDEFPTKRRPVRRELDMETDYAVVREWVDDNKVEIGEMAKTEEERERAYRLVYTWRHLFSNDLTTLQQNDLITHTIPLQERARLQTERTPMFTRAENRWMDENFPKLEAAGVICMCTSPWSSRIKLVAKKDTGKFRMVNNVKKLNDATERSTYPMQRQELVMDTIFRPGYDTFFVCDGSYAYWGIPLAEEDQYKTAFNTPKGQYCMRRMGQGLTDAPFTYARFTNMVFGDLPPTGDGTSEGSEPRLDAEHEEEGVSFTHFMNDTYSSVRAFEPLFTFLHYHFFPRVEWARMSLNPSKSAFFAAKIKVLGFDGSKDGIRL